MEIADYATYDGATVMFDVMGFGWPLDETPMLLQPGVLGMAWGTTIRQLAAGFGIEVDEIKDSCIRIPAPEAFDVAAGHIPKGGQAALRFEIHGMVKGKPVIVIDHVTRLQRRPVPGVAATRTARRLLQGRDHRRALVHRRHLPDQPQGRPQLRGYRGGRGPRGQRDPRGRGRAAGNQDDNRSAADHRQGTLRRQLGRQTTQGEHGMGRVDDKVALISGGARGMGAAHARMLVDEGAKVVIGDILDDEGKAVADDIGDAVRYVHLDVTQPDQWQAAVDTAVSEFGKLNVLVNNAAIVALGPLKKFDLDEWQKVIDVNLTGTFLGMRAAVQPMIDAGGGSIINVSSIEGLRGAPLVHPVRGVQVGGARTGQVGGTRVGAQEHSGQLLPSRLHPHPDDRTSSRGHGHHSARPAGRTGGGVDVRGLPGQRRVVVRHRQRVHHGRRPGDRGAAQVVSAVRQA